MPVYKWSRFFLQTGRDGTDEPTEGSTRGPRGPKNRCVCIWSIFRYQYLVHAADMFQNTVEYWWSKLPNKMNALAQTCLTFFVPLCEQVIIPFSTQIDGFLWVLWRYWTVKGFSLSKNWYFVHKMIIFGYHPCRQSTKNLHRMIPTKNPPLNLIYNFLRQVPAFS